MGVSNTVPVGTLAAIVFNLLLSIAVPAATAFFVRKRFAGRWKAFFAGTAAMLLFAFVLEQLVIRLIFQTGLGEMLLATPVAYALFGALMAGLFEETGRFTAYRTVLKKDLEQSGTPLMYGAGHGGFEMLLLLGTVSVNNLVYSIYMNTGMADAVLTGLPAAQADALTNAFAQLSSASPGLLLIAPLERLAALTAQIALSVLVWTAARRGGKRLWLFPLAIFLHFALDAAAGLLSSAGVPVLWIEGAVWVLAILFALFARTLWKEETAACAEPLPEGRET